MTSFCKIPTAKGLKFVVKVQNCLV